MRKCVDNSIGAVFAQLGECALTGCGCLHHSMTTVGVVFLQRWRCCVFCCVPSHSSHGVRVRSTRRAWPQQQPHVFKRGGVLCCRGAGARETQPGRLCCVFVLRAFSLQSRCEGSAALDEHDLSNRSGLCCVRVVTYPLKDRWCRGQASWVLVCTALGARVYQGCGRLALATAHLSLGRNVDFMWIVFGLLLCSSFTQGAHTLGQDA